MLQDQKKINTLAQAFASLLQMLDMHQTNVEAILNDLVEQAEIIEQDEQLMQVDRLASLVGGILDFARIRTTIEELKTQAENDKKELADTVRAAAPAILEVIDDKTITRNANGKAAITVAVGNKTKHYDPVAAFLLCNGLEPLKQYIVTKVDEDRFQKAIREGEIKDVPLNVYSWEATYTVRILEDAMRSW